MRTAARTRARVSFAVEPQEQRVAAELEQAAAVLVGDLRIDSKLPPITSVICSAPSRPLRASCSDNWVNPEISTNAAVPSAIQ